LDENRSDKILRTALRRDDPSAVELIWDRYANDLLAFLLGVLCSKNDAEDVLQTIFVKIVLKRHRLAKARYLDAYLYRIARNEAYRFISKRKREKKTQEINESWLTAVENNQELSGLAEKLQMALNQLKQSQREVIILKIYRQKTFLEISRLLGISQNTAASRYRYGLENLRSLLWNIEL
jgi:RNA polymerase sigma-70 factor (ECF subfamily)